MSQRRILVNAFDMNTPTHLVTGTWTHPDSRVWRDKELGYWTDLARENLGFGITASTS